MPLAAKPQAALLSPAQTLTTAAWFRISSTEYTLPTPLPGQISQVFFQALGEWRLESQNGQVRHWRGRGSSTVRLRRHRETPNTRLAILAAFYAPDSRAQRRCHV